MRNDYKYDDPDFRYTDPKTSVLRNKLGIDDAQQLHIVESFETSTRLIELRNSPIKIKSADSLLKIHEYLFQDLYDWAGKVRIVEISKEGKPFLPTDRFAEGFSHINSLIAEYRDLEGDVHLLSNQLSKILDAINYFHPFREGNGRTQREFIRILALEKGYYLDLNTADDESIYDQYMTGTIEGNIDILTSLIESIIKKL